MNDDPVGWIRSRAQPIATTDPTAASDDLRGLLDVIGDARVVGLGESTHGTREFSLMKHRIIKLLTEEAGFRVIAFERDVPLVGVVDDYVCGADVRIEDAMSTYNVYPWQTEELRGLLTWMRARNRDDARLRFVGIDMQAPDQAIERAGMLLGDGSAEELGELRDLLAGSRSATGDVAGRARLKLVEAAGSLAARTAAADPWAALNLRTVEQGADLDLGGGEESSLEARERAMADNVITIAEEIFPGERVVIWAHNGHVGRSPKSMGEHLAARYGERYRIIGFSFHSGSYAGATFDEGSKRMDRRLRPFDAGPLPEQAVEHWFHEAGIPMFALDLRDPHPALREPREARLVGFVGGSEQLEGTAQADAYDAVVHIDEGTAAIPVPWSDEQIAALQGAAG